MRRTAGGDGGRRVGRCFFFAIVGLRLIYRTTQVVIVLIIAIKEIALVRERRLLMAIRKLMRKMLMAALLAVPLGALADPIYAVTPLRANFHGADMNKAGAIVGGFEGAAETWRSSEVWAFNDAGQAVGTSEYGGERSLGFVYIDGVIRVIPSLSGASSHPYATKNSGQVAGYDASEINDAQQILARACNLYECTSARRDVISAVPELPAWSMLLAGVVLLGGLRRREQRSAAFR
jgi:hypothetical protein